MCECECASARNSNLILKFQIANDHHFITKRFDVRRIQNICYGLQGHSMIYKKQKRYFLIWIDSSCNVSSPIKANQIKPKKMVWSRNWMYFVMDFIILHMYLILFSKMWFQCMTSSIIWNAIGLCHAEPFQRVATSRLI